jgi:hypothetical protein
MEETKKKINWKSVLLDAGFYLVMILIGVNVGSWITRSYYSKQHEQDVELLNLYNDYYESSAQLIGDFIDSNDTLECSPNNWNNCYSAFKSLYEYLNDEEL